MPKWLLVQTFYKSFTNEERGTIDASANGALMNMFEDDAYDLIEQVAANRSMWGLRNLSQAGKYKVDYATKVEANLESLIMKKIDDTLKTKLNVSAANQAYGGNEVPGENMLDVGHPAVSHAPMEQSMDQVNSINNFDKREQRAIYSNTYNRSWRNHPNLSWGGNQSGNSHGNQWRNQGGYGGNQQYQPQGNTSYQHQQNYQPPYQYQSQLGSKFSNHPKDTNPLEQGMQNLQEMIIKLMTSNDQRFSKLESDMIDMKTHYKMLENKISQVAQQVASSSSTSSMSYKGKLPSQPQPNPRGEHEPNTNFNAECKCVSVVDVEVEDECKKIALRSGKVTEGSTMDEKV